MNHNNHGKVCFLTALLALSTAPCAGQDNGCAVWSKQEGGSANIYLSKLQKGTWGIARKINDHEGVNITPTVSMAANEDIWLVWVEVAGNTRKLKYFILEQNGEKSGEVFGNANKPCFSPSIAVDNQNTPWLAWAMGDGTDEDIYFSRWQGAGWQPPQRVHADNGYPDITPTIGLGTQGQPWITWQRLDGSRYATLSVFRGGDSWQPFAKYSETSTFQALAGRQMRHLPTLPSSAEDRLMGSLFVRGAGEIQSMSERMFKFNTRRLR